MAIKCSNCGIDTKSLKLGLAPRTRVCKTCGYYYCVKCARENNHKCPRCGNKIIISN